MAGVRGHFLKPDFFATRIAQKANSCAKAFAPEVMDAVHVLVLFADAVVVPSNKMQKHVRCLELFLDMITIMAVPEDIMLNVDTLEDILEEHAVLYKDLYKTVPKFHLGRHIVDNVKRFNVTTN